MKRMLWVFLILLLSGCASGPSLQEMKAADPPKDDNLIVPGWRVGKVYLGMTSRELVASMGEPSSTKPGETLTHFFWKNAELGASLNKKADRVDSIMFEDERYKTAEGIRVGLSELSVVAKLGQPQASGDGYHCYKSGIMLRFREPSRGIPYQVTFGEVKPREAWRARVEPCS